MSHLSDYLLHLHGWTALALIFAVPALESSAFLGFLFPGEITVLLGGVLAYQHRVGLAAAIAAACLGAVVGDTVGYEVGKHVGRRILDSTIGRFVKKEHLDRAQRYLAERGGKAVFLGRFTAALRVLIPGMAGMSGMPYGTFALYNVTGGVIWATGFVLLGYAAGSSYRQVESVAKRASLLLLIGVIVVGGTVLIARNIARHPERIRSFASRQANRPWVASLRRRYRRELDFLLRRFNPSETMGLSLTFSLVLIAVVGSTFGLVMRTVLSNQSLDGIDRPVLQFFVDHREPWLTTTNQIVTRLGSAVVLVPLIIVVGLAVRLRRGSWRVLLMLSLSGAGAEGLSQLIKALVQRPRPVGVSVGHFTGWAFPSGHATASVAVWGMFAALVAAAVPRWTVKVTVWTAALLTSAVVGASRLYLGAHWLTDVLGGWSLGAMWLFALLATVRTVTAVRTLTPGPET